MRNEDVSPKMRESMRMLLLDDNDLLPGTPDAGINIDSCGRTPVDGGLSTLIQQLLGCYFLDFINFKN